VDETALTHRAQEIGFEGRHFVFPESVRPIWPGRGVHERARLAPKRDQQKWNPVLRSIARQAKIRDQQKWNPVLRSARMKSETIGPMLASSFRLA
jgi:hypothetical protein